MTEKKEVKSAPKAAKKSTTKKASAKKAVAAVAINAENVGFKGVSPKPQLQTYFS